MAVVTMFGIFRMRAAAANLMNACLVVTGRHSRLKCTGPQLLEYTDGICAGHAVAVGAGNDLGSLFFISQKTALPRLTSCFMRRMRASLGQHFLLL